MNRRKFRDKKPAPNDLTVTGAFLSSLFQDLQLDIGTVKIVSDNAKTKRIRELVLQTVDGHPHSNRSKCRWLNIIDDATKSPSFSSSSSSRKILSPSVRQHQQSSKSSQSTPTTCTDTDLAMPKRRISKEILLWDSIVVDKQNVSSSSRRSTLTFNEEEDCLKAMASTSPLPGLSSRQFFPSPSASKSSQQGRRLPIFDSILPLKAPTRQTSLEKEENGLGNVSVDDTLHTSEHSIDLEAAIATTESCCSFNDNCQPSTTKRSLSRPLLVPQRMGFVDKLPNAERHDSSENEPTHGHRIQFLSRKQRSWSELHSARQYETPQLYQLQPERPSVARASSVSYWGRHKGAKDATSTLIMRLCSRVDHIRDESMQNIGTINSSTENISSNYAHESSSSIESISVDTIPSLPVRRGSIEKKKKRRGKRPVSRQPSPSVPPNQKPALERTCMEMEVAATSVASRQYDVIDPFSNGTARLFSRNSSIQPGLLRSVEVRTPTPPRSLLRSSHHPLHLSETTSLASSPVELHTTTVPVLDILPIYIHDEEVCSHDNERDASDDDSDSLSTCSTIYSNTRDQ
ncbi:hypothetical protein IV203_019933 [Nitzschia inconspicua]|uniref:Uncharacterized protein n=1 Tax=Nitzschia inconspicua TaxID=303405 RepID=A0A9K3LZD9_9STRA|nr:hypothetical protein IV203_019933 [Nitzschia inconspicua]